MKYKVSLAVKIPANYEVEIEAKNEKEAQKLAIKDFEEDFSGEIIDCDYDDSDITLEIVGDIGVYVEKI